MNVLVVGSGGREHALAWKLSQSSGVGDVFVAPGNAGTAVDATNVTIAATDTESVIGFSKKNDIGLVVVGPEAPLVAGMVDALDDAGIASFGPSAAAAELEGSKVFCKQMLHTANIPTATFQTFRSADEARRYIRDRFSEPTDPVRVVVKADGLAAGKGVIVCSTREDAFSAVERIAGQKEFGSAGDRLVIEERLTGPEVSVLAITDGETIAVLPPAQDHKPALDGDRGPNTGGMGAYCSAPVVDENELAKIEQDVLVQIVHAMKRARRPFKGVLYAGLMMTPGGPKVLEFNVRFGDPECQPLLMRMKTDLLDVMLATSRGDLGSIGEIEFDPRPSVCVVMASEGYPGDYEKGRVITGLDAAGKLEDVKVFHAGTKLVDDQVVTDGGRVLGVTSLADSIAGAKLRAYEAVREIRWPGAWCRKDIADKAMSV